jgi:predicted acylesterase/phospholipase RssA
MPEPIPADAPESAASPASPLELPAERPPCGIIMKGGITSGVVYPKAAAVIAEKFRFRQVGGTSAGAIAAAATAAAELGRQSGRYEPSTTYPDPFAELADLPRILGEPSGLAGRSKLSSLFQPQERTRPLFDLLLAALDAPKGAGGRWGAIARQAGRSFPRDLAAGRRWGLWAFLGGLVVFGPAIYACGYFALAPASDGTRVVAAAGGALLIALWTVVTLLARQAGGILGAGRAVLNSALHDIAANDYGLCSGFHTGSQDDPRQDEPPLTEWLYGYLNKLAGLPRDRPLTFGDLWGAEYTRYLKATPAQRRRDWATPPEPAIELEVMSTCVSLGRPFRLPDFSGRHGEFRFRRAEMARLFPDAVVTWMEANSVASSWEGFQKMPHPADLPVIVAVRMSLSFPILFSAVPLYSRDKRRVGPDGTPLPPEPCWFSDGGITSNFPMHLFEGDEPIPRWPVFGLNLRQPRSDDDPLNPRHRTTIVNTNQHDELHTAWWTRWEADPHARTNLGGFLGGILNAAQNWSDNLQATMPGFRERIAHIHLSTAEGGINLNMPEAAITAIAGAGEEAAKGLNELFLRNEITPSKGGTPVTWGNYRWWRFRSFMAALQPVLTRFAARLDEKDDFARLLDEARAMDAAISYEWNRNEETRKKARAAALDGVAAIQEVVESWDAENAAAERTDYEKGAPQPRPLLRVSPRI